MNPTAFYRPLTATPFRRCAAYSEIEPCAALRTCVRCFWGGAEAVAPGRLVIPDTCADIIYTIDHTAQTVDAAFCGVNDRPFSTCGARGDGHAVSVFAIRFYAWRAYVFAEDSLDGTLNGGGDARAWFSWLDRPLRARLPALKTLPEQSRFAEALLLKRLETARQNAALDSAAGCMLLHRGAWGIDRLSQEMFLSTRQLERLFHEYAGVTPKKLSSIIRYQCLWSDVVRPGPFPVLDAVCRYGYTDTAHLMREFKRYHSMDLRAAKALAEGAKAGGV